VQQWFAATDCDDCCPQFDEPVHAAQHYGGWNRLGE
jgi:hypothetical protein